MNPHLKGLEEFAVIFQKLYEGVNGCIHHVNESDVYVKYIRELIR